MSETTIEDLAGRLTVKVDCALCVQGRRHDHDTWCSGVKKAAHALNRRVIFNGSCAIIELDEQ